MSNSSDELIQIRVTLRAFTPKTCVCAYVD